MSIPIDRHSESLLLATDRHDTQSNASGTEQYQCMSLIVRHPAMTTD